VLAIPCPSKGLPTCPRPLSAPLACLHGCSAFDFAPIHPRPEDSIGPRRYLNRAGSPVLNPTRLTSTSGRRTKPFAAKSSLPSQPTNPQAASSRASGDQSSGFSALSRMAHQGLAAAVRCSRDRGPAARGDLPRWYAVLLAFGRQRPRQHLPGIDQRPGCWTQCSVARACQAVPEVGGQSIASLENPDLFSAPASRRCRLHRKCSGQPAPIAPQSAERVRISSLSTGLSTATRPSSSADAPIGRRVEAGLEPAGRSVIAGGEGLGWASGPVKTPVPRLSL